MMKIEKLSKFGLMFQIKCTTKVANKAWGKKAVLNYQKYNLKWNSSRWNWV